MSRFGNLELGDDSEKPREVRRKAGEGDGERYFAEAELAFTNGNFESALRLYSKVLEFNPGLAAAWTGQVRMLIELGEYHEAGLWADKALERFPHEAELLASKAVASGRGGDLEAALTFSDAAISERGDTPYVWLARGDVLLARDESRADYCLEKAQLLAPKDWVITWLAARIRTHYAQFGQALKLLQHAIELNASHFLLWLDLGRCQQELGMTASARDSYGVAKQFNPDIAELPLRMSELRQASLWSGLRGWWRRIFSK